MNDFKEKGLTIKYLICHDWVYKLNLEEDVEMNDAVREEIILIQQIRDCIREFQNDYPPVVKEAIFHSIQRLTSKLVDGGQTLIRS